MHAKLCSHVRSSFRDAFVNAGSTSVRFPIVHPHCLTRSMTILGTWILVNNSDSSSVFCPCTHPHQVLARSISVGPEEGPDKYLYMAQLHEGRESLGYYEKGLELLQKQLSNAPDGAEGGGAALKQRMCMAHCSVAELFLTDLCYEEDAESRCQVRRTTKHQTRLTRTREVDNETRTRWSFCCSHINSHNQVRGHRTGSSHSGAGEYPRGKHKQTKGGTRIYHS